MSSDKPRVGFLASGRGSNFEAILRWTNQTETDFVNTTTTGAYCMTGSTLVTSEFKRGLRVFDISTPGQPEALGRYNLSFDEVFDVPSRTTTPN